MPRSDTDDTLIAMMSVVRAAFDSTVVTRKAFDELAAKCAQLARGAMIMHLVNRKLYERLKELERLASSWSGSPQNQPAIRQAREALVAYRADMGATEGLRAAAHYIADRW